MMKETDVQPTLFGLRLPPALEDFLEDTSGGFDE
jgi:hypothetical protein